MTILGSEWRPIESAPKQNINGPYILVWNAEDMVVDLAFWEDEPDEGDEVGWRSATNHDDWQYAQLEPTHWMPLPPPPGDPA